MLGHALSLKSSYGKRSFGANTMNGLLTEKLIADAPLHTLAMQARGGVKGSVFGDRLVHLGADHSVPPAMAVNVGPGFPDRKIWAASSSQTRAMHSLLLVPDGSYESIKEGVKDLKRRRGGPPRIFAVDDMPNNEDNYMADLEPDACVQDLVHGLRRIIITLDPEVKPLFNEICAELAQCYTVVNHAKLDGLIARLTIPAGSPGGLRVGGRYTRKAAADGEDSVQVTLKLGDVMTHSEVRAWMDEERSSFWDTFHQNIWRDWREPEDIRARLNKIANKIDPELALLPGGAKGPYEAKYGCMKIKKEERCVFTSKTLAALRTQAEKAKYYQRPAGAPRYMELGEDGRGLIILAALDGTNKVESDFHKLETTESASSYKPKHAHGLLMASAERLSVKGNVAVGLLPDLVHSDMQLARERNAVCRKHGFAVPYPMVADLEPDTGARFVHEYWEQQLKRRAGEPVPVPPTYEAPDIERYYQSWEPKVQLSLLAPVEGLIDYKRQRHNNPCAVGGPCCALRKHGSCVADGRHVKHKHVPGCRKGQGNEQAARDRARWRN